MFLLLALQLQIAGQTTPPTGDTTGYWQQRVEYRIAATLDERRETLVGRGTMKYVNNSPDTLRELYFHQYLNAFRPGSRWSAVDERENRERFQRLEDPHHGFERFTALPRVDDVPVTPQYPFAPDSAVVRLALARPLAPGDSLMVQLEWEARPSTVPRRQGRRGRQYDFAHWYPRIAVYDRAGWQYNTLVPAGEFYGEFGDYDVTLVLADDQVVGATGIPVEGDPGWDRARVWGTVYPFGDQYGDVGEGVQVEVPARHRPVRFVARDVHHFAFALSPEFRYEGGLYDGRVPVHVLYRPESAGQWGDGQAARRTALALAFLEQVFGTYVYPQVTNLNRLDGGGTEFPMMMMNFSASQGLILHELAHIYIHGILANNEWRHAWLDEGLASYLTLWGQGMTPIERAAGQGPTYAPAEGYRANAHVPAPMEAGQIQHYRLDLIGRAEPMATLSHEFSEFGLYNQMSYRRGEMMWGALRDIMGDSVFIAFLREFYSRWQLRHVDELAVRTTAADVHGAELDWFFDQWLYRTGLIDYELADVRTRRLNGEWVTGVRVVRRGEYVHPMPVVVRVDTTFHIVRADRHRDDQWLEVRTPARPDEIRIDPLRVVDDWDRRNHVTGRWRMRDTRFVFDWPFLAQLDRDKNLNAIAPFGWYTEPGRLTLGLRSRSNYQGWLDLRETGLALALREPELADEPRPPRSTWATRVQLWATIENPTLRFLSDRPLVGWRAEGWKVDGLANLQLRRRWDVSRFVYAAGTRRTLDLAMGVTSVADPLWRDERWDDATVPELRAELRWAPSGVEGFGGRVMAVAGAVAARSSALAAGQRDRAFVRAEGELRCRISLANDGKLAARVRAFAGVSDGAPAQRSIGVSSLDPTQAFNHHMYRGAGAPFVRQSVHYVPLGGAGARAYPPLLRTDRVLAGNAELERALHVPGPRSPLPSFWITAFGDVALASGEWTGESGSITIGDAGIGFVARGSFYDRDIAVRVDLPFYVSHPELAFGGAAGHERLRARWTFSLNDLW